MCKSDYVFCRCTNDAVMVACDQEAAKKNAFANCQREVIVPRIFVKGK